MNYFVSFVPIFIFLFNLAVIIAVVWYALTILRKLTSIDQSLIEISRKLNKE